MDSEAIRRLLTQVSRGKTSIAQAMARLRHMPFEPLGFANVDHHRSIRCGFPEAIYCPGKTPEQVTAIFDRLASAGTNVLATRASPEHVQAIRGGHPNAEHHASARTVTLRQGRRPAPVGHIAIVAAGTSDLPVAEEARVTSEIMDQRVTTHYDVGVAGLHRLLAASRQLQEARVIVVVAGMEGALASVVGGLVAVPVIAVPTSVGYGANFGGLAALLTMLNSCAAGVSVVNIDNGFAAGHIAAMINRGSPPRGRAARDARRNTRKRRGRA